MNKEHQELYNASRHVKDVRENEKIHFVSMVKYQNISIAKASELLMKSYNWGKECMQRYDELGLDGLKILPKSGRPLLLSNIRFKKIIDMTRRENGSVDPKQVMHNIKRKTGVKYHISNIKYQKKTPQILMSARLQKEFMSMQRQHQSATTGHKTLGVKYAYLKSVDLQ